MDITETFRPEDLPKTDFFDFVTSDAIGIGIGDRHGTSMSTDSLDPPLQGFDQVTNLVVHISNYFSLLGYRREDYYLNGPSQKGNF